MQTALRDPKVWLWDLPGDPVVKTLALPMQGPLVQSLVRELRFHMPHSVVKKKKKKKRAVKGRLQDDGIGPCSVKSPSIPTSLQIRGVCKSMEAPGLCSTRR